MLPGDSSLKELKGPLPNLGDTGDMESGTCGWLVLIGRCSPPLREVRGQVIIKNDVWYTNKGHRTRRAPGSFQNLQLSTGRLPVQPADMHSDKSKSQVEEPDQVRTFDRVSGLLRARWEVSVGMLS